MQEKNRNVIAVLVVYTQHLTLWCVFIPLISLLVPVLQHVYLHYPLYVHQVLAMKTAEESGSTLILANDPDTDRLAVAREESRLQGVGSVQWQ